MRKLGYPAIVLAVTLVGSGGPTSGLAHNRLAILRP